MIKPFLLEHPNLRNMISERKIWKKKFGKWFRKVIDEAGILDYRYPIKGCGVWLSYGFKLRRNILAIMRRLLDESGHEEMLFPLLIPEDLFAKESMHIKGFEEEAYWVTHGGSTKLSVKMALRPTSETVITPMAKFWIRSHADMPIKVYQIASVFRYETKATKPLIRIREVTTFKEAHTFHASHEDALKQLHEAIEIYRRFFDEIGISYVISQRPEWDRFAGAVSSYAFDTLFPDDRTLQVGTVHDLGQNFAKAFDVRFETSTGQRDYAWQTSYGISERVIAAVLTLHGDDRGLVLPPNIVPIQVIVIPIPYKGMEERVNEVCRRIVDKLKGEGIRVELDDRSDLTPGSKFYEWEMRGVPLRVEVGPRDIEENRVTFVRRDNCEKSTFKESEVIERAKNLLVEVQDSLKKRAWEWLNSHIREAKDFDEAKKLMDSGFGIVKVPWCGKRECGVEIERKVNARVLGIPSARERAVGECVFCGHRGEFLVSLAKAY